MNPIEEFLLRYVREYDFYQEVSRLCAQRCELVIQQSGIRAIVSYRAKRLDRLAQKIEDRNQTKHYATVDDIYLDLVDLAGVRIALYFPGDRDGVKKQIENIFLLVAPPKEFPLHPKVTPDGYNKRFSGYSATHFRVRLKEDSLPEEQRRYAQVQAEVQVASVLMHAWAEVEHDLIYKPLSGTLSRQEYAILDELNGLVLTGEIALENLQTALQQRVSADEKAFNNHYELAAYLHKLIRSEQEISKEEVRMGRADILLRFLQLTSLDQPSKLRLFVIEPDPDTLQRPIVEQIVDNILAAHPEFHSQYQQAQQELSKRNPYSSSDESPAAPTRSDLDHFISRWIALEAGINQPKHKQGHGEYLPARPRKMIDLGLLDVNHLQAYQWIRQIRNQLVHGVEIPSSEALREASITLEEILEIIRKRAPSEVQSAIDSTLQRLDAKTQDKDQTHPNI